MYIGFFDDIELHVDPEDADMDFFASVGISFEIKIFMRYNGASAGENGLRSTSLVTCEMEFAR